MNLADLLSHRASASPDTIAVIDSQRSLTLAGLESAVWALAAHLHKEGVRPGNVIGLQVHDPLLHVIATFTLARLGAIQLGVSTDSNDAERSAALLKRAKADVVLSDTRRSGAGLPGQILLDPDLVLSVEGRPNPAIGHPGGDWPLIYKTSSGTTGNSKIVGATHQGMMASIEREQAFVGYPVGERYLTPVALPYDAPKRRYLACIVGGGTAVLSPPSPTIEPLFELMDRHDVRHFSCVPRQASDLVNYLPAGRRRFPHLRLLRLSAAPADRHTLELIRDRLNDNIALSYGCSELGPITFAGPQRVKQAPYCVGPPMPGVRIEIVSADDRPLPTATTGIVRVQAQGMPNSYIGDETATAQHFRGGWFYPGDLGSIAVDGALTLMGRSDDMMICDGVNIAPREIESVLQEHPWVLEVAAFPLRSKESYQLPAAAVVSRPETDMDELLRFARERLGSRGPVTILAIVAMPRNAAGKILKNELAKAAENHLATLRK